MEREVRTAVVNFAKGLNGHIVDNKTFEHNRHAVVVRAVVAIRIIRPSIRVRISPGTSAFSFSIACSRSKRAATDPRSTGPGENSDWHLQNRFPNGLVRGTVRTADYETVGQHDSLALCVSDAANLLGRETRRGKEFGHHADGLFDTRRRFYKGKPPKLPEAANDPRLWLCGYTRKNLLPEKSMDAGNALFDIYQRHRHRLVWRSSSRPSRPMVARTPARTAGRCTTHAASVSSAHVRCCCWRLGTPAIVISGHDRPHRPRWRRNACGPATAICSAASATSATYLAAARTTKWFCDPWATHALRTPQPPAYTTASPARRCSYGRCCNWQLATRRSAGLAGRRFASAIDRDLSRQS